MQLSYQWYSNTTNSNTGGTIISGETSAHFTIPTTLGLGTYYYYVGMSASGVDPACSNVATVCVSENFYLDENGALKVAPCNANVVTYTNQTLLGIPYETTWYIVNGTCIANGRITITGDVRIILADNCHLNASIGGINVAVNNSLTIYAQSTGASMGKLTANGANALNGANNSSGGKGGDAGIGGNGGNGAPNNESNGSVGNDAGTIIINGGTITAKGGNGGNGTDGAGGSGGGGGSTGTGDSGNNGGSGGNGANIIINGGEVIAYSGNFGLGCNHSGTGGGPGGGGKSSGIGGAGGGGAGGGGALCSTTGAGGNGQNGNSGTAYNGGKGGNGGKGASCNFIGGTSGGSGGNGGSGTPTINGGSVTLQ